MDCGRVGLGPTIQALTEVWWPARSRRQCLDVRPCQHAGVRCLVVSLVLLAILWAVPPPAARARSQSSGEWSGLRALVDALADRFGPVVREPGFEAVRPRVARAGVVPSPLFDDATAWQTRGESWRAFELAGHFSGGMYRLGMRAQAPRPVVSGHYRARVRLERISSGRFEWTVSDDLSVGDARAADLAHALDALLRGAEQTADVAARAALTAAFPRASAQFGQLFRIDALTLRRDAGGTTEVRLAVRLTPATLRGSAPHYAEFLTKHAGPLRLSLVVADPTGATWWTLEVADFAWTLRLRVRNGNLAPLEGPADRTMPDRMRATFDVETRLGRFQVGARRVVADLALTRTPAEKALAATFLREPEWRLPLMVETLLDSPLRYPFESPGTEVAWAIRDTPDGGLLTRRYRARIRESWILRWLGGMVNDAVGQFRLDAEREADRFTRACWLALRDDLIALDGLRSVAAVPADALPAQHRPAADGERRNRRSRMGSAPRQPGESE
jgi:hypothetical protein